MSSFGGGGPPRAPAPAPPSIPYSKMTSSPSSGGSYYGQYLGRAHEQQEQQRQQERAHQRDKDSYYGPYRGKDDSGSGGDASSSSHRHGHRHPGQSEHHHHHHRGHHSQPRHRYQQEGRRRSHYQEEDHESRRRQHEEGGGPRSSRCLYCPERLRGDSQHALHRATRHPNLDFGCQGCNFASPESAPLAKHLENAHGAQGAEAEGMLRLAERGLVRLPSDLRTLRCRLCSSEGRDRQLAGQDRVAMRKHVEMSHDGLRIGLKAIKYECRVCKEEFPQTEEFLKHPCCKANGQDRVLIQPLMAGKRPAAEAGDGSSAGDAPANKAFRTDDTDDNPLFVPFANNAAAATSAASAFNPEADEEASKPPAAGDRCLFCERMVASERKASHRASHWDLEFMCGVDCTRSFAFVEDALSHLRDAHEEECQTEEDLVRIASEKKIILPVDLRSLQCPLCPQEGEERTVLLAQDRYALKSHLKEKHGVAEFDKSQMGYKCRYCSLTGFSSSGDVLTHPCASELLLKQSKKSAKGGGGKDDSKEDEDDDVLMDLDDLEHEPPKEEGDLRRLACRLCAAQTNGTRFFAMVEHMEQAHHKFQVARNISLDDYVKFGCANCPDFAPTDVHVWAAHFGKDDSRRCEASPPVAEAGEDAMTEAEKEMERKRREEAETEKTAGNGGEANPGDLRTMRCKLCEHSVDGQKFLPMQEHLRRSHPAETVRSLMLDSFVRFGCSRCPAFEPGALLEWDKHFYKSYVQCTATYREDHAAGAGAAPIRLDAEADDGAEWDADLTEDLRRLRCLECKEEINRSKFSAMGEHLKSSHEVDVLKTRDNFEEKVEFGCALCPSFRPPTVILWDDHFSDEFNRCQGSSKVYSRRVKKVLFWCDTCGETRSDLESHLQGASHKKALEHLLRKVEKKKMEQEEKEAKEEQAAAEAPSSMDVDDVETKKKVEVVDCTDCGAKTTSEANARLHRRLAGHGKN